MMLHEMLSLECQAKLTNNVVTTYERETIMHNNDLLMKKPVLWTANFYIASIMNFYAML